MLNVQHLSSVALMQTSIHPTNLKPKNEEQEQISTKNSSNNNINFENFIKQSAKINNNNYIDANSNYDSNNNSIVENKIIVEDNDSNNDIQVEDIELNKIDENEKSYTYFGMKFRSQFKWFNLIIISLFHIYFLYGLVIYVLYNRFLTTMWGFVVGGLSGFGITGGAHRYWTHRSYKAKLPLKIILAICYSIAGQNTIFDWVRDHRIHHKFSETDADPHNSNRGFFFAHVGWLMMKKHPKVIEKGRQIDMSDILNDPVVRFHQKHFILLKLLFCFILPTLVPIYCWGENVSIAITSQCVVRYILGLNFTWLVNSAAHIWGKKPYDKRINPVENWSVAIVAMGEGWHNYHHVFPWDYKAAELGNYSLNFTTFWIDFFAKIGWAYDLKVPSKELVQNILRKHGDGSHPSLHDHPDEVPDPEEDENGNIISRKEL